MRPLVVELGHARGPTRKVERGHEAARRGGGIARVRQDAVPHREGRAELADDLGDEEERLGASLAVPVVPD